jgi:NDP-sugar pyrophosphorylase family protein
MRGILHGQLKSLQDFGGRVSEDLRIWIQGESIESLRRREEIMTKLKNGRIHLEGSVLIGRHCSISDGATIADSCIDNYSQIGRNAVIRESAVMDRVVVGDDAHVRESIIGRHSTVESSAAKATTIIGSVLADDITVCAGCTIGTARIYPHRRVTEQQLEGVILK